MNPENQSPIINDNQSVRVAKNKPIWYVVLALCLVGIVFFGGRYAVTQYHTFRLAQLNAKQNKEMDNKIVAQYQSEKTPALPEGVHETNYGLQEASSATVYGQIVFSGIDIDTSNLQKRSTQLYTLDLGSSTTKAKLLIPAYYTSAMATFKDAQHPKDFFLLTASAYSQAHETDTVGIHLYDMVTGFVMPYISTRGVGERDLEWSEQAQLLAFDRFISTDTNINTITPKLGIEDRQLVIVNPKTDSVVVSIDGAYQPKWSPDGTKILYLRKDGLYLYTLDTKTERKLVPVTQDGAVIATSMFDLSNDGKYVVWTTSKMGTIVMYEVTSWQQVSLTELGRIQVPETEFYWPQFSPDSNYYVVQAIDTLKGDDIERKNGRLEIRPTLGREIKKSIPMDRFFFDGLFTDDWIAELPKA